MWVTGNSGVTLDGGTPTSNVYSGKNQMSSGSYETAGNQTPFGTLTYDAENHQATATESLDQQLLVLQEFLHWTGTVGADSSGQRIKFPNGDKVTGSAGVSEEVRKKCF